MVAAVLVDPLLRHERAEAWAADAAGGTPGPAAWGLWLCEDACPAAGGGVGSMLWFEDRAALLDFLARGLPHLHDGPLSADRAAVAGAVHTIVARLRAGGLDDAQALALLRPVLRGFTHVSWWGPREALESGPSPFARGLRAELRASLGRPYGDASPLTVSERAALLEFLRLWAG
jgi:hypothetical protein